MPLKWIFRLGLLATHGKTQDGRKILLTDMTERHIRNCMKLTGRVCGGWYEAFADELKRGAE